MQVLGDRYPVIQTTAKASEVLTDGIIVEMPALEIDMGSWDFMRDGISEGSRTVKTSAKSVRPSKPTSVKSIKTAKAAYAVDEGLFANLKTLRLQLAAKEGVPAFVIFSDAALYDMCAKLPTDDKGFLSVSGVGEVKLKKYGSAFLKAIREHLQSGGALSMKLINTETGTQKEPIDHQSLFESFQFSDEPIHMSEFLEQANLLLMRVRGRGTSAANITKMLEDDGYLEMKALEEGRRGRMPTQKGVELSIESRREESPDGRMFLRNYYGIRAQKWILSYIKALADMQ